MKHFSLLLVAGALTLGGAAFAQGTPPTTAPANPATGAGQQSPAGGAMGTTGTTPQNTTGTGTGAGTSTPSSSASGGSTMSSGSSNDTSMAASSNTQQTRPARADRN